jgi:hypothetical protein
MDHATLFLVWFFGLFVTTILSVKIGAFWAVFGFIFLLIHGLWAGRRK